jgi:calcium binding protein 39
MIKYISVRSNLRTIMILLSDPSAHIQMEAFNVFKIFVANPTKPNDIIKILVDNKIKLIKYLTSLHQEKEATDSQFREEKVLVISTLENLEMTTE